MPKVEDITQGKKTFPTPWIVSSRTTCQPAISIKLYYAVPFALNGIEPWLKVTNMFSINPCRYLTHHSC